MRLVRLNLTRYGKFTNDFFDFGPKLAGKPDFHVIYGDNEAGKTTTLTAFLDLMFGIKKDNPYNFLHPSDTMEIGGVLEFANCVREFRRVKKQSNSLLDANGQAIPEAAILAELDGLGRSEYELKFSLDADTLKTGGRNILASKGDLGELLFAASAGVADLSHKLNQIRETIDDFYRVGTRKNGLSDLKSKIKALDERKKEIDTLASKYAGFVTERKKAGEAYEKALKERTEASNAKRKITSIESALPRFDALTEIAEKLSEVKDVSDVPPEMKEQVACLQRNEIALHTALNQTLENIANWTEELKKVVVDETALESADRLDDLAERRARYLTAEKDIPKLRPQIGTDSANIAVILREIGRKDEERPEDLILEAKVTVALRELIESRAGVDATMTSAVNELGAAETKLAEAEDDLKMVQAHAGVADHDALTILNPVVAEIRRSSYDGAISQAHKTASRLRDDLAEKLKPLAPWRGGAEALASLRLPDAPQIERWKTALETAEKAVEGLTDKIKELTTDLADLEAQKNATAATVGVVSDNEAALKRLDRDAAWMEHRRALTSETADAFHIRLHADDVVTTARLTHASEIARINNLLAQISVKEKAIERQDQLLNEAQGKLDTTRSAIAVAIKAVSGDFAEGMSPSEFSIWASSYEAAVKAYNACRDGECALREAKDDHAEAVARLETAMEKCGIAHVPVDGLETMMSLAQAALDKATNLQTLGRSVEIAHRELGSRKAALKKARDAVEAWETQWKAVSSACWIGKTHPEPSIRLVSEILTKLSELQPLVSNRTNLEYRVTTMERDQNLFADSIQTLADDIGEDADGRSPIALADKLAARVNDARKADLIQSTKKADIEDERKKEESCRRKIAQGLEETEKVFAILGVATLIEAAEKVEKASVKAGLLEQKAKEERLILRELGLASMTEAEEMLAEINRAELSIKKADAESDFDAADKKLQEAHARKISAEDQIDAVGGDEAVAKIDEERQTILLEVEEKARQWLRMRAGILAAELALRMYREKHRSTMLSNASDAFKMISRGAYSKLMTRPEGTSEKLIGLAAAGGSKDADQMSKGTQFQLYLALRIAGYQEYANARQPPSGVPFIADDIMETFDNHRAKEAFGILAKIAEVGQVIYLTHHEHLCAIAQKVCPEVRLHKFA